MIRSTMSESVQKFRDRLNAEYERRFPRSRAWFESGGKRVLDGTSHAIRWNDPFMPLARRASGAAIVDIDGHRLLDYWQGHFANLHGHNPVFIREALAETLVDGRGLQSGMLHEIEGEVSELICEMTASETVRLTTSGSLGTFYAMMLARAFTGRDRVLKVGGGWHGSQPFGLKGVSMRGSSFDHLESEGLPSGAGEEILLTRFNDVEDLRRVFSEHGDRVACFVVEPVLGAAGGMVATREYLEEARALTAKHGALLLSDEIITAFRYHAGSCISLYGVRPDLLILGKVLGGGMPVAAVAGRRDVLKLCTREVARVKFEGGTYSAHELSLVAARAQLRHLRDRGGDVYANLARLGRHARDGLQRVAEESGVPIHVLGASDDELPESSLVMWYPARAAGPSARCPEELAERAHPVIDERLLKSTLMLEGVSVRSGMGAVSEAHDDSDLDATLAATTAALARFRRAGLT
jgi:glutamate-1-semialdehyde 2,1-aminomutase